MRLRDRLHRLLRQREAFFLLCGVYRFFTTIIPKAEKEINRKVTRYGLAGRMDVRRADAVMEGRAIGK